MKRFVLNATSSLTLLALAILTAPHFLAFAQDGNSRPIERDQQLSLEASSKQDKEERIEGVWDSRVTIRNCQSGNPVATFRAMETFIHGGGLVDTNANPPSTRGPGLGRWQHTKGREFTATFRFFLYNPDGSFAGVRRVSRVIQLGDSDNDLTSTVSIEVFDPNDVLISTACATEVATRVE